MEYNNNGELFDHIVSKTKLSFFNKCIDDRLEEKEACKFMH